VTSTVGPAVRVPSLSQPGGCLHSPTFIKEMTVNDSLARVKWVVLYCVRVRWLGGFTAHSTIVFLRISFDNSTRPRYYYYYCYSVLYHRYDDESQLQCCLFCLSLFVYPIYCPLFLSLFVSIVSNWLGAVGKQC